jgi:hypothetical protein
MRACILVHFAADADLSKARHALSRPGITSLDLVTGPYDAIVTCDVADMAGLSKVALAVRACPGIRDTITCPVVQGWRSRPRDPRRATPVLRESRRSWGCVRRAAGSGGGPANMRQRPPRPEGPSGEVAALPRGGRSASAVCHPCEGVVLTSESRRSGSDYWRDSCPAGLGADVPAASKGINVR